MTRRAAPFVAIAAWIVAVACVDTTPGVYVPVPHDAGAPISGDSGQAAACTACFKATDGACHPTYEACTKYPACLALIECVFATGCFEIVDLQSRIACANPCTTANALPSGDPLVVLGEINTCVDGVCASACLAK